MNISQKLIIGFVGIALLVGVVGYLAVSKHEEIKESYVKVVDDTVPEIIALENVKSTSMRMIIEVMSYASILAESQFDEEVKELADEAGEEEEEEFLTAGEVIKQWEAEYSARVEKDDVTEQAFITNIRASAQSISDLGKEIVALKKKGVTGKVILEKKEILEEIEEEFFELIDEVIAHENDELKEEQKIVSQNFTNTRNTVLFGTGASLLFAIIMGIFLARTIINPIEKLKDAAADIGNGKLDTKIVIKSKDEIGFLANSINEMTKNLKASLQKEKEYAATSAAAEVERQRAAELESAYDKLKDMQNMIVQIEKLNVAGQLAGGVAHEVKNPLSIILQSVEYLKEELPLEENASKVFDIVTNNIARANNIINDLVDFSRVGKLDMGPIDINSTLESSLNLVQHRLKMESVDIAKDMEKNLPKISADKVRMEQVFINIILNAIQAMDQHGKLFIRTYVSELNKLQNVKMKMTEGLKPDEKVCVIEIEDTGAGIPENIVNKIFDPFFTTKSAAREGGGGTGLGLSVTKNIVLMHGGLIHVESKKDKGTKFTIVLNLSKNG